MCAPMIAATAFVLQSVLAELTREQCAAVAAVNNVQLSVEPAHYCGCNFKDAAKSLEYTPAGAICTESRAEYTSDPHTVTANTKFNGTAASTFLVARGTRGCFLKCAYDSSCTAASAKNNQFEDTECFLFDSVSSTISEEGTTSVLFAKGSAAVAPLDSSSTPAKEYERYFETSELLGCPVDPDQVPETSPTPDCTPTPTPTGSVTAPTAETEVISTPTPTPTPTTSSDSSGSSSSSTNSSEAGDSQGGEQHERSTHNRTTRAELAEVARRYPSQGLRGFIQRIFGGG